MDTKPTDTSPAQPATAGLRNPLVTPAPASTDKLPGTLPVLQPATKVQEPRWQVIVSLVAVGLLVLFYVLSLVWGLISK